MRTTKKLLSLLLAFCMVVSLLPATALAAEGETGPSSAQTEVVLPEGITSDSFKDGNTVYDGTNYYQTMMDALAGIHKAAKHELWCKPGADVGAMTHGHVCASLTVYGNGAYISGGERDFELEQYSVPNSAEGTDWAGDVTLEVYNLDGVAAWGTRRSAHTLNIYMENCDNMNRVYLNGTTGPNNITLKNCTFDGTLGDKQKANNCTVYSNAGGIVDIQNCTFTGVSEPINMNTRDGASEKTINVTGCTFTDCGLGNGTDEQWAAPIRIVNSGTASCKVNVTNCTFSYTEGNTSCNGDILIGDGRANKVSNDVALSVSGTQAEVQFQEPGYHAADGGIANKDNLVTMEAKETDSVKTSLREKLAVAQVGLNLYQTLDDAIKDAHDGQAVALRRNVTIPKAEDGNSWAFLINKSIVIDGQGKYTITDPNNQRTFRCDTQNGNEIDVTFQNITIINSSTEKDPRCIETRNDKINLVLDHVTLKTTTTGNSQPLTIGGNHSNPIDVTINGSEIVASPTGYAIVTFNPSNMLIEDSTLTGWAGLYFKGVVSSYGSKNANVTVKNSTINSGNTAGAAEGWNNFGAIVFEDNGVTLTLEDAKLNVSSVKPNETQEVFSFNKVNATGARVTNNKVYINGSNTRVSVSGDMACISESAEGNTIAISDGYFTVDPSAFLADRKAAVASGRADYPWRVTDATDSIVEPAVGEPSVEMEAIDESDREAVEDAAKDVDVQGLAAYASTAAQQSNVTKETAAKALNDAQIETTGDNTYVYAQAYLEITPTSYTKPAESGGESVVPKLTMDITPMYRLVASTADDPAKIAVQGDTGVTNANAVVIPDTNPKELDVQGTVHMVVPMPDGFVSEEGTIFVQHKNYEYVATVTTNSEDKFVAEFDNPHGFSTFSFTLDPVSEARLNGVRYVKLADAIADAVDGDVVNVMKSGLTASMSGDSRKITLKNETGEEITITVNGKEYALTAEDDTVEVTYTKPTPGDGGSSTPTYAVTADKADNGAVSASAKYAAKGTTVTVTVTPDEGYVLSGLTVTDKNGNALTLTEKGNGKYTFVMPDGAVTVKAAFGPESLPFTDVSVDAYYANAVKWAVDKGVTSGLTATTFGPNESCTRAQMVTFLWRAAGSPVVNYAMKFTDVPADAYYAEAVRWAVSQGITAGVTETAFGPEQTVTRAQVVAFLYRQAGSPAVGSKNPFTDVASDAYYADAVKWAVAQKITAGTADTAFSPDADCTRGQIVTFLYNDMAK